MDREAEVIVEQMEETRESLAKKLETLEHQVAGTVQAVTGTVEAVSNTVEQVKEAVQGTVENVKESVEETVETVKETLDISGHVRRHPWAGFGVSFALGFVGGKLLQHFFPNVTDWSRPPGRVPSLSTLAEPRSRRDYEPNGRRSEPAYEEARPEPTAAAKEHRPGLLGSWTSSLGPEISKLKGLAIGAALGMARDAIRRAAPQEIGEQLAGVVNDLTSKLGGEVLHGPVLPTGQEGNGSTRPGPVM
jgi:ElaB/YqjD/DUF883 family membrane-anchored ribosome-binding protein